jgi:Protein of unknown function (DUF1214)
MLGIHGNSKEETFVSSLLRRCRRQAAKRRQSLHSALCTGAAAPADDVDDPAGLLVANPLDRYLLNSTMLDQFKRDADDGFTFYIQHESPSADKEAHWLPALKRPFGMASRFLRCASIGSMPSVRSLLFSRARSLAAFKVKSG